MPRPPRAVEAGGLYHAFKPRKPASDHFSQRGRIRGLRDYFARGAATLSGAIAGLSIKEEKVAITVYLGSGSAMGADSAF